MSDKLINFHIYRYHLLPIENNNIQIDLFEDKKFTDDKTKERKNEFFGRVLDNLDDSNNINNYPLKLVDSEDDHYLFKLAQKKTKTITQNFKNLVIDDEPYVYVIFNNKKHVQKIAISDNNEAFSKPDVVKKILTRVFKKDLVKFGLNFELEALYDKIEFWSYIEEHQNEIIYIKFEFIKPNLANISGSLPKSFRDFSENTNSHESHITIKAPENGTLENITKSNENIKGLVDYTSEGAGSVKLRVKGIRKQVNTESNHVTTEIEELKIEGSAEQIDKLYKKIVE